MRRLLPCLVGEKRCGLAFLMVILHMVCLQSCFLRCLPVCNVPSC